MKYICTLLLGMFLFPPAAHGRVLAPASDPSPPDLSALDINADAKLFENPGKDTDEDGFSDLQEKLAGTDAQDKTDTPERTNLALSLAPDPDKDSDGDGVSDQDEYFLSTDPFDVNSRPSIQRPVRVPSLAPSLETQFHADIVKLAAELDHDAIKIYRFVKNNIRFEEYRFSVKGAVATLHTRAGNEWDQCSLLIALLRASGIPSRYTYGDEYVYEPWGGGLAMGRPFVAVQAWIVPGQRIGYSKTFPAEQSRVWAPLTPWRQETVLVYQGADFFPVTDDGNFTLRPELKIIEEYFTPPEDPEERDQRAQQTPLQFFEAKLQAFIVSFGLNGSILEVPRIERTQPYLADSLPLSFPTTIRTVQNSDAAFVSSNVLLDEHRYLTKIVLHKHAPKTELLSKSIFVTQSSGRRLVLDPGPRAADGTRETVLRLDGHAIAFPIQGLIANQDRIFAELRPMDCNSLVNFQSCSREQPPVFSIESMVLFSFDILGASAQRIQTLQRELYALGPAVALSSDDEAYIGRQAALFAEISNLKYQQTFHRVNDLLHLNGSLEPTTMMIWTNPEDLPEQLEPHSLGLSSAFMLHPAWHMDVPRHPILMRKKNFPLRPDAQTLPWPGHPFLEHGASELLRLHLFLLTGTDSYYEAAVFEFGLGGPALSTVTALIGAEELAVLTPEDAANEAALRQRLAGMKQSTVDRIIEHLKSGPHGRVYTPTTTPKLIHPDTGETLLEEDAYAFLSPNLSVWAYTGNNGSEFSGQSVEGLPPIIAIDPTTFRDTDFLDGVLLNIGDDFLLPNSYETEVTNAAVFAAGDPVNLVTGEFYHEADPDLVYKTRGNLPFSIVRRYRNQSENNGLFGWGWSWNHGEALLFEDVNSTTTHVHYHDAEGRLHYLQDTNNPDPKTRYQLPPGSTYEFFLVDGEGYRLRTKSGEQKWFDLQGRLVRKLDRNDNALTFHYDELEGKLRWMEDELGRKIEFFYEGPNPTKVSRASCNFAPVIDHCTVQYEYDGNDLITVTNAKGHSTRFEYYKNQDQPLNNHNLKRYILPNDDFLEITYAENDRVALHTNQSGSTFEFSYNIVRRISTTRDENNNEQTIHYDANNNVIRHDRPDGSIEYRTYDDRHNLESIEDGLGHITQFTYSDDERRNRMSRTDGRGKTWLYQYDPVFNRLSRTEDPLGNVTELEYDAKGNLERKIVHLTQENEPTLLESIAFEEVPGVQVPGTTVPQLQKIVTLRTVIPKVVTEFGHDGFGNRTTEEQRLLHLNDLGEFEVIEEITDRDRTFLEHHYDELGFHRTATTDVNGHTTQFRYDPFGRLERTIDPTGHFLELRYDRLGNVTERHDSFLGMVESIEYDGLNRVTHKTDANNATTVWTYAPARDLVQNALVATITDPMGYVVSFEHDAAGNVVKMTNQNGHQTLFEYDPLNRLTAEIDHENNVKNLYYDAVGNLIWIVDRRGDSTVHRYDEAGNRVETTDAVGRKTVFRYDDAGRVDLITDPIGVETSKTYDPRGFVVEKTIGANLPASRTTKTVYDGQGRVLYETDARGIEYHRTYLPNGEVVSETVLDPATNQAVSETVRKYDSRGLLTDERDGRGYWRWYEYDPAGRRIRELVPNPVSPDDRDQAFVTTFFYDGQGNLLHRKDAEGFSSTFQYSPRGENVLREDSEGSRVTFTYDGVGNIVEQTDELGLTTVFYYNTLERRIEQRDPSGAIALFAYDAVGNQTSVTDGEGVSTTRQYDPIGRVIKEIDNIGNESSIDYVDVPDEHLHGTIITDRLQRQRIEIRDGLGDLVQVTAPEEFIIQYDYDGNRNVTEIRSRNSAGNTRWQYRYDALNQRTHEIDADLQELVTGYDPNGNAFTQTLRDNRIIRREHDALNRLVEVYVDDQLEQEFSYDRRSLLRTAVDFNQGRAMHTVTLEYDSLGRRIADIQDDYKVSQLFNARGELTHVKHGRQRATWDRDQRRRMTSFHMEHAVRTKVGYQMSITGGQGMYGLRWKTVTRGKRAHNANYQVTSRETTLGVDYELNYGARGELESRNLTDANNNNSLLFGENLSDYDAELNYRNNLRTVQGEGTTDLAFTYDNLNRLATASRTAGDESRDLEWSYDPLGNWTSVLLDGVENTRTVNADNEYLTISGFKPAYDAHGNITQPDSDRVFSYDWNHRLTSVADSNGVIQATYTYDALGRRITKSKNGQQTTFRYNGDQLVGVHTTDARKSIVYDESTPIATDTESLCDVPDNDNFTPLSHTIVPTTNDGVVCVEESIHPAWHTVSLGATGPATTLVSDVEVSACVEMELKRGENFVDMLFFSIGNVDPATPACGDTCAEEHCNTPTQAHIFVADSDKVYRLLNSIELVPGQQRHHPQVADTIQYVMVCRGNDSPDHNNIEFSRFWAIKSETTSVSCGFATESLLTDHLGSVVQRIPNSEHPTLYFRYDPYGNLEQGDLMDNDLGFAGGVWDADAKAWYFLHRYYDPTLGRFLQRDPLDLFAGPNRYEYARSNPLRFIDRLGLVAEEANGGGFQEFFSDLLDQAADLGTQAFEEAAILAVGDLGLSDAESIQIMEDVFYDLALGQGEPAVASGQLFQTPDANIGEFQISANTKFFAPDGSIDIEIAPNFDFSVVSIEQPHSDISSRIEIGNVNVTPLDINKGTTSIGAFTSANATAFQVATTFTGETSSVSFVDSIGNTGIGLGAAVGTERTGFNASVFGSILDLSFASQEVLEDGSKVKVRGKVGLGVLGVRSSSKVRLRPTAQEGVGFSASGTGVGFTVSGGNEFIPPPEPADPKLFITADDRLILFP